MDKSVYLFELDSVRKSKEEIEFGQNALFDEIIMHGNTVICTFNQVTDSPVFLAILGDEEKYKMFLKLINLGTIRISRYGSIKTPSQYVQENLKKNIDKIDQNSFIFSSLPIRYDDINLQKNINQALMNSDLSIFDTPSDNLNTTDNELIIFKRYIELILKFSIQQLTINEPKNEDKTSMSNFIFKIIEIEKDNINNLWDKSKINIINQACSILKDILDNIKELKDNRSVWINKLHTTYENKQQNLNCKEPFKMAEAMIDLCYNYALEDSILEVSKHYKNFTINDKDSFYNDFFNRLRLYYSSNHKFLQVDSKEFMLNNKFTLPEWKIAALIIEQIKNNKRVTTLKKIISLVLIIVKIKNKDKITRDLHYEENFRAEYITWNILIVFNLISHTIFIIFGIISFFIFETLSDLAEEKTIRLLVEIPEYIKTILNIFIFVIIITLISSKLKIPDLLDSFKKILSNIKTILIILRNKNDSYNNL